MRALDGLPRACGFALGVLVAVAAPTWAGDERDRLVERGRQIYMEGAGESEITAVIAQGVEVPASILTCGSCHGQHGEGRPEGGVSPTDLRPSMLRRPYEVTTPSGRRHGPYDNRALVKAIALGLDPAGNTLQQAMPRYRMSRADMDALIAFLEDLDAVSEAGVSNTTLRVGVPVPIDANDIEPSRTAWAVADAVLGDLAASGGIFGRRPEAVEVPIEPRASLELCRSHLVAADVFALVGGASVPVGCLDAAEALGMPWVGAPNPSQRDARSRPHVFFLEPNLAATGVSLADHAARRWPGRRVRVVRSPTANPPLEIVEEAFAERLARLGEPEPAALSLDGIDRATDSENDQPVLLLAPGNSGRHALDQLADAPILSLAPLVSEWLGSGHPPTNELHIAMPAGVGDAAIRERGRRTLDDLATRHPLATVSPAFALRTLTSIRILNEGLRRLGGDPRRDHFVAALESLRGLETGISPPVTYGPNRRSGFDAPSILVVGPDQLASNS